MKIEAALRALFHAQRLNASRTVEKYLPGVAKAAGDADYVDPAIVLAAIDFSAWDALPGELEPLLAETGTEAVGSVFATLEVNPIGSDRFALSDTQARDYARARGAEMVGKKWVNGELVDNPNARWAITDTTRADLRELIADAFDNRWTPAQLAKEIDSAFTFSAARAKMIAQTETAMAHTHATVATGKRFGAKTKSVKLSSLHDIDDECNAAQEAGEVPIDEPYPEGGMHVPLHPRCMCVEFVHIPKRDWGADEK